MNAPQTTCPTVDSRAKTPSLAESAAKAKGLKAATPTAKPEADKLKADKAPVVKDPKAEADKAKAKLEADKAKAKLEADKAKAEAARAKAKAKEEADKLKAKAKEEKAKEREAAKAARIAAGGKERLVPADLSKYTVDKVKKTAGGHASVDSGDALAQKLRGSTIDAVYKEAAKVLKEPEAELRAKYTHLNIGMQRMNLGNRMRAADAKHG